jgi:hypothetical protein
MGNGYDVIVHHTISCLEVLHPGLFYQRVVVRRIVRCHEAAMRSKVLKKGDNLTTRDPGTYLLTST